MAKYKSSAGLAVGQGVIGFALIATGTICALGTLLGFFGSTWWLFDYAANFRAHFAVVLLIVALAYSLLFSKTTGLFFMVMAMVNGLVLMPAYLGGPAPAAAGDDLTIVSFNVGQRASIRDTTFRWIDSVDPDLVVLVEATSDWFRATEMAEPYQFLNGLAPERSYGIAVLAREDLDAELVRVTSARDNTVRVEARIGDKPVVVYTVQSPPSSNEADASIRSEYFANLTRLVNQETEAAVVVGDFQSTHWTHTFNSLAGEADLVNSLDGFGLQSSWPADRWRFFRMPFDHLLHSEDLTTVDRYLGPTLGVEHRPMVVQLAIAG